MGTGWKRGETGEATSFSALLATPVKEKARGCLKQMEML
jgi:hypothetical protein